MSDTEFVKLIIETMDTNKFFESIVIPIEIKEIYCQLKNNAVKNYLRHLSLKAEENITTIKLFMTCVGEILQTQGTYAAYVKIFKNYSMNIYFNDFLVQAARNCTIIPENNPMKLPLKIAFGVMRDLLQVFFGQETALQTEVDLKAIKERNESLRKDHLAMIISNIDKVDLVTMDKAGSAATNTSDVLTTIMNIPEIKSELDQENITRTNEDINTTSNNLQRLNIHEDVDEEINHDISYDNGIDNDNIGDEDDLENNEDFILELNKTMNQDLTPSSTPPPPLSNESSNPNAPTIVVDRDISTPNAETIQLSFNGGTGYNLTADDIIFDNINNDI